MSANGLDALRDALEAGQSLPEPVRRQLVLVLNALTLSEQDRWRPLPPDASWDEQQQAAPWHASAWVAVVERYWDLLAEVREHGVTVDAEVSR